MKTKKRIAANDPQPTTEISEPTERAAISPAFISSHLDDYGLTPSELRVYCHLSRRAGKDGKAWPALSSMAQVCKLETKTVKRTLKNLVEYGMIGKKERKGNTSIYWLQPYETWQPHPKGTRGAKRTTTPPKRNPNHLAQKAPPEGYPLKVIQEGSSIVRSEDIAEEIYFIYPKKVGKPKAKAEIRKALRTNLPEYLKDRTAAFAKTQNGDLKYCPHPSTWFSQARFNDDPSTWTTNTRPEKPAHELTNKEILQQAIS